MTAAEMRNRIKFLEAENAGLRKRCHDQFDEHMAWRADKREDRWHATRDAYLARMHSGHSMVSACEEASEAADLVHGPIEARSFPSAEVAVAES